MDNCRKPRHIITHSPPVQMQDHTHQQNYCESATMFVASPSCVDRRAHVMMAQWVPTQIGTFPEYSPSWASMRSRVRKNGVRRQLRRPLFRARLPPARPSMYTVRKHGEWKPETSVQIPLGRALYPSLSTLHTPTALQPNDFRGHPDPVEPVLTCRPDTWSFPPFLWATELQPARAPDPPPPPAIVQGRNIGRRASAQRPSHNRAGGGRDQIGRRASRERRHDGGVILPPCCGDFGLGTSPISLVQLQPSLVGKS